MEEAIKKIKEEMGKNKSGSNINRVAEYVLVQIETNKEASKKIEKGEKSLSKAMKHLMGEAQKRLQKGESELMLEDEEVFEIINRYFGFNAIQGNLESIEKVKVQKKEADHTEGKVIEVNFDINLEDLL